jgi:hypothetical protein
LVYFYTVGLKLKKFEIIFLKLLKINEFLLKKLLSNGKKTYDFSLKLPKKCVFLFCIIFPFLTCFVLNLLKLFFLPTYCYYFLCYIIVVFALSLLSIWIIFHFYYFIVECITTPKIKKKNSLPPPIWRKNRQLWTHCKTTGYGNWTYTKWIAILGFLNIEMEFLKKNVFLLSKKYPQTITTTTTHRLKKSKKWN